LPGGSGTAISHDTRITHITQTNNYTNNKGHIIHNEYKAYDMAVSEKCVLFKKRHRFSFTAPPYQLQWESACSADV
jgi:hypothetical protein